MANNILHFLVVPFTGLGKHNGYRGDEWLKRRIQVFDRFVLPSLVAQTKKEFVVWFCWRPEEKTNPIVQAFERRLSMIRGLSVVFTYHGINFWDDKYPDHIASFRLLNSLKASLPEVAPFVSEADWVYLTVQPSDDLYATHAVEQIQKVTPGCKALAWRHGYLMNYSTKEVAEYNPDTLSPFTTIIFPKETFLNPLMHYKYIGPYKSHEFVFDHVKGEYLDGRGYMVGTHGENISTTWNIPYKGKEILVEDREEVWLEFGCWDADPIIVHKSLRLVLRNVFNATPLPLQAIVKSVYHLIRKIAYVSH